MLPPRYWQRQPQQVWLPEEPQKPDLHRCPACVARDPSGMGWLNVGATAEARR